MTITLQPHERDLWGRVYATTCAEWTRRDAEQEADAAVLAMREREPAGPSGERLAGFAVGYNSGREDERSGAPWDAAPDVPPLPEGWAVKSWEYAVYCVSKGGVWDVYVDRHGDLVIWCEEGRRSFAPAEAVAHVLAVAAQRRPGGDR